MQQWAADYEQVTNHHWCQHHGKPLPPRCFGRAKRLKPEKQLQTSPSTKPSRQGEVQISNALAGTATRLWFRQLRRIQSLKHAVLAKMTPSAVSYRTELWQAIRQSTGFSPCFPSWWQAQAHSVDGVFLTLPLAVPSDPAQVIAMYESFLVHFRAFEAWHLQQRTDSLRLKYQGALDAIYLDLRKDPRQGAHQLWKTCYYTILAVDHESHQIHLDQPVQMQFDSVWLHNDHMVPFSHISGDLCTVSDPARFAPGDELVQRLFVSDTNDLLKAFTDHWRPRWSALAEVPAADWQRIV
eukprot:s2367_g2.t1